MFGPDVKDEKLKGIIPRAASQVFGSTFTAVLKCPVLDLSAHSSGRIGYRMDCVCFVCGSLYGESTRPVESVRLRVLAVT